MLSEFSRMVMIMLAVAVLLLYKLLTIIIFNVICISFHMECYVREFQGLCRPQTDI